MRKPCYAEKQKTPTREGQDTEGMVGGTVRHMEGLPSSMDSNLEVRELLNISG